MVKALVNLLVALSVLIVSFNVVAAIESLKQVSEKLWVMGTPSAE